MWKINPFFHNLHLLYTPLYWFKLYSLQWKISRDIYDGMFVWLDNHLLGYLLDEYSLIILNCWYPTFILIIRLTPWHAYRTYTSRCSNLHSLSFSYVACTINAIYHDVSSMVGTLFGDICPQNLSSAKLGDHDMVWQMSCDHGYLTSTIDDY